MLSKIGEHIRKRTPRRARTREHAPVPAIRPQLAPSRNEAIDGASDAHRQPAHSAGKRVLVVCFHQEMEVVGLNRKLDDSQDIATTLVGGRDGVSHCRKDELAP
jgi:hypothetical protein